MVAPLLLAPLLGLAALLAWPSLDGRWEHHPSHLWIVLAAAGITGGLAYAIGTAAERRSDPRVALLALAFLVCGCFLGLHALATPTTLLETATAGFVVATPVGLVAAGAFAAASALVPDHGGPRAMRLVGPLRMGVLAVTAVWAVLALGGVPPLGAGAVPDRGSAPSVALALVGLAGYAIAIARYAALLRRRPGRLTLATVVALSLLAEATLATALSPAWHLTWWGWHVLILAATGLLAWAAHREWHEERFGDLYLAGTAAGERDLSVLFADLEGFTRFAERSRPAEVSAMLNRYLEVAVPAVTAHGGVVDRLMGDALMATFNRAGDRPDHAGDALRAAVALQEATAAVAAANPGWPRFRVGLNTGTALVCILGVAGGRTHTVVGDTVNVAARLEGLAPSGGIALSPETARRAGAVTRPLGRVALKGRDGEVEALLLLEPPREPGG